MADTVSVMVLDDEPIVCARLKDLLSKNGYEVEVYTESSEALQRLKDKTFDVVVTDLKMRGPSGLDVLREVRAANGPTQVIMITAYGSMETARAAECVGTFGFLPKPFKMNQILELVGKAAKRASKLK